MMRLMNKLHLYLVIKAVTKAVRSIHNTLQKKEKKLMDIQILRLLLLTLNNQDNY